MQKITEAPNQERKKSIQALKKDSILLAQAIYDDLLEAEIFVKREKYSNDLLVHEESENGIPLYRRLNDDRDIDIIISDFVKRYHITDVWKASRISEIKRQLYILDEIETVVFDDYDNLLCLRNGVLNLDTMELAPHSPDNHFTTAININYEPDNHHAPTYTNFINSLFAYKGDWENGFTTDSDTVAAIDKIGGYLLHPRNVKINRSGQLFIFVGSGSNGKSMLLDIFQKFFPQQFVTSLNLEQLSNSSSFEREPLLQSRLNITTEQRGNRALDSEEIKKIVSGENVTVQRKYREPITFRPRTKLILASNSRPYFADTSYGMRRRLYMVEFKNSFVHKDDPDAKLFGKGRGVFEARDEGEMMAAFERELPAILNRFIVGLQALRADGWYIGKTENSQQLEQEYEELSDKLRTFLLSHYEEAPEDDMPDIVLAEDVRAEYIEWYRSNIQYADPKISVVALGRKIADVFKVKSYLGYKDGRRIRGWPLRKKTSEIPEQLQDL